MTTLSTDLEEFEEQIRLQNTKSTEEHAKTRVDPDGTVMEWDEKQKAWFPKIDEDFIAQYQMNFGLSATEIKEQTDSTHTQENLPDWSAFNAQVAELRSQKGEDSEEVQALVNSAQESLQAYYNSPAYREWYANYQQHVQPKLSTGGDKQPSHSSSKTSNRSSDHPAAVRPAERVLRAFADGGELGDAESALARAEAEQQAGVPISTDENDDPSSVEVQQANNPSEDGQPSAMIIPGKRKQSAPPPAWYEVDDSKNTHVYISGLPPAITDVDFLELMSKYGVLMKDPLTEKSRIKLYRDPDGVPKGDGRCCYVKVESVDLALKLLDGSVYSHGYTLSVERAKFQPKGEFDPKRRRRLTLKEKKKMKSQQENMFRWSIDTSKFVRGKKERVIILKNVFVETDFLRDVTMIPVVRERVRQQCAKCGTVKKIVVHDANPLGVVSVTLLTPEEADTALGFLDKALFPYPGTGGPRQLTAERWDGKTNYAVKEDDEEACSRIDQWEAYLGGSDDDDDDDDRKEAEPVSQTEPPDYWETGSDGKDETDSPVHCRGDTDDELDARGDADSGAETD